MMRNINSQATTTWTTVNDSEFEHSSFHWHDGSQVLTLDGQTNSTAAAHSAQTDHIDGILFINDTHCVSALSSIKAAVQSKTSFCVCNDRSLIVENENNQQQPQNNKVGLVDDTDANAYLHCLSSGSSGKPKRVCRSHVSWIKSFQVTSANANLTQTDSYAIIGRLSHSLTLYAALEAAWIGADIHAIAELRPDKQYAAMKELGSSVIYATPTQLRLICSNASSLKNPNAKLRTIFCGGGKLDKQTRLQLQHYFPNALVKEFYGSSETSFITISDENTPIESVGRAYPNVEILIKPITDSTGEVWVKSPYLFEHYSAGNETDTQWHKHYLSVGELGYLNDDGYLFLSGRRSRMINVADNMVFPEQIETLIEQHASVNHCAAIAIPDDTRGKALLAIVESTTHDDKDDALRTELLSLCRKELGNLKSPRQLVFVKQMPLLPSGKIDLQTLTQHYQST